MLMFDGPRLAVQVIVSSGGKLAMAVVTADDHLLTAKLDAMVASGVLKGFSEKFGVAAESEFAALFEHAEPGAFPRLCSLCIAMIQLHGRVVQLSSIARLNYTWRAWASRVSCKHVLGTHCFDRPSKAAACT